MSPSMATAKYLANAGQHWLSLLNSPTWLRDATTVTSPWRLGFWFMVLNALIIGSLIYVDTEIIRELDNQTVIAELGLGRLLAGSIFLALTTFVTVFVPVRTAGVFYGPRLGRYFDQIILSGITPWRFLMGKVLGQQAFFATVVAVSLPYFILCLSFGGVFFWEVLLCTFILLVYVQVLVIVYLAFTTFLSEIIALPLVIGLFGAAGVFGLLHVSPNPIGGITPVSTIMGMLYEDTSSHLSYTFRGGFGQLGLVTSHVLLYGILSLSMIGLGSLAVALGPINALTTGLNTFGAVVLPGDKNRASWLKKRFDLRRQSEFSFLYENNSAAWRTRDFQRRWSLRELVFVLFIAAALIWTFWLFPPFGEPFYLLLQLMCVGAIFLNAKLFADSWMAERLYTKRLDAGTLNALHFCGNSVLIWLGFGWLPSVLNLDVEPNVSDSPAEFMEIQETNLSLVTQFVVMGLAFYAILRWIILRRVNVESSSLLAIFLMIVIAFIPIWLSAFANLNTALDEPDRFPWLAMGNPIEMIESANSMRRPVSNDDRIGLYWSASLYSFVALLFTALTWKSRQRLPRRRL